MTEASSTAPFEQSEEGVVPAWIIPKVRARAKVRDRAVVIAHLVRRRLVDQIHAAVRRRPHTDFGSVDARERIYLEIP